MLARGAIEIRAARESDSPELRDVCARTLRACDTPFLGAASVQAWIAGEPDGYLHQHVGDTWVAVDGAAVCGCVVVTGQLLAFLLVDVDRQRRGIGVLLVQHAEELVFRDHDEIPLECFVDNDRATAFYERCSWTRGARHLDEKTGVGVWRFGKSVPDR